MSFILDALKKSDAERQRNTGPTLAEIPRSHRPPQRPWWAYALGGLLLINLIIFGVVLLRGTRSPAPATQIAPAPAAAPAAPTSTPSQAASTSPAPVQNSAANAAATPGRSLADEAAISAPTAAEEAELDERLAGAAGVPDRAPIVRPSAAGAVSAGSSDESPPTISDFAAHGLPQLHMDMHSFAATTQKRFVSINGHIYTEGQRMPEGPTVERITRDGAVLSHQGSRFLLPRN